MMDNLDFPSLQERLPSRIGLMFSEIASNYDRMNLLMTAGLDKRWRQEVIRHCHLKQGSRVLDLGTGTAELAIELAKFPNEFQVVGSDISLAMMFQGRKKPNAYEIGFTQANALILPFPDGSFDAVVSGFVMRNLPDQAQALTDPCSKTWWQNCVSGHRFSQVLVVTRALWIFLFSNSPFRGSNGDWLRICLQLLAFQHLGLSITLCLIATHASPRTDRYIIRFP